MHFFINFVTGVAGMCSKTAVAPLDRIKILLQAHSNHYKHLGVFSGLRHIVHKESLWALYKGNSAQMVRIFPYAATQFTAFEFYKRVSKYTAIYTIQNYFTLASSFGILIDQCFFLHFILLVLIIQYVGALIPTNRLIKNSDKFIAGAGAGVTAVRIERHLFGRICFKFELNF